MTATTTPTFRPFTEHDWLAFVGAQRFPDGSEPLVAEGQFSLVHQRRWLVVLDCTGGCLLIEDDPQNDCGGYVLDRPFADQAEARAWFEREIGEPVHHWVVRDAGFERL